MKLNGTTSESLKGRKIRMKNKKSFESKVLKKEGSYSASCELSVASCQLRVASCQLRVGFFSYFASCELRVASCELRAASWKLVFHHINSFYTFVLILGSSQSFFELFENIFIILLSVQGAFKVLSKISLKR